MAQKDDLFDKLHKYLFDHATSLQIGGAAVLAAFFQFPSVAGFRKRLSASVESACSRPWFQRSYSDMALLNMLAMHTGTVGGYRQGPARNFAANGQTTRSASCADDSGTSACARV